MLSSALGSGKAFHALFISSMDADASLSLARRASALCINGSDDEDAVKNDPDYHYLAGEETGVNEIRAIIEELSKAAFEGGMRAIVISNAHAMTREAQNALLKTLEEPPKGVIFLLCGNADGMLSTIISRCALIRLGQADRCEIENELALRGVNAADARLYARISGYHGVLRSCNGYVYAFGSALLDLEEPWKVTARSGPYLISPRETYECMGDVPNVTFPCAALHDPATGRVAVYYGCADTVTGLAFGYIPEIIDFTKQNSIL